MNPNSPELVDPILNPYTSRKFILSQGRNPPTHQLFASSVNPTSDSIISPFELELLKSHPLDSAIFLGQKARIQFTHPVYGTRIYDDKAEALVGWLVGLKMVTISKFIFVVAGVKADNLQIAYLTVPGNRLEAKDPLPYQRCVDGLWVNSFISGNTILNKLMELYPEAKNQWGIPGSRIHKLMYKLGQIELDTRRRPVKSPFDPSPLGPMPLKDGKHEKRSALRNINLNEYAL